MTSSSPIASLLAHLGTPAVGQPTVVVAAEGVGKTPFLTHVALHHLLAEQPVLYVSLSDTVDHVRTHHDEVLRAMHDDRPVPADLAVAVERRRIVLSYAARDLDPDHLAAQLTMLADVADFRPALVVLDGIHPAVWAGAAARLATLVGDTPLWVGLSGTADEVDAGVALAAVLHLAVEDGRMGIHRIDTAVHERLPWQLDPTTLQLEDDTEAAGSPAPATITLYSGGAAGAEQAFGEAAARHGVAEVNFTFDGHRQARSTGRVVLSPRELEAGDVSLVYVSRRLHRTYNQHGLIRKVLQTLWHMVSRAQQIFVVGVIQDDGTVVGGTGWSVELARMWSKEVWVYDQERLGWFRWRGSSWEPDTPTLHASRICGTGTRYLSDHGRRAIDDLFAQSLDIEE